MSESQSPHLPFGLRDSVGGATIFALDLLALMLANWSAGYLTSFLQVHILDIPSYKEVAQDVSLFQKIFVILSLLGLARLWSKGLYTLRTPWWTQVQHIGKTFFLIFLLHGFIAFSLKIYESRLLIAVIWSLSFGFVLAVRWGYFWYLARRKIGRIETVIIADNSTAIDLVYAFESDFATGYVVRSVFLRDPNAADFVREDLPKGRQDIEINDGQIDYAEFITAHPDLFFVVSLDTFRGEQRDHLINVLNESGVSYAVVPSITRATLYEMEPRYFFGYDITMLEARRGHAMGSPLSFARIVKRLMDVTVSGTALLCLSPVFVLVALFLKLEGQSGRLFYGGERIGYQGNRFKCWKFQSMEPNSDHLLNNYLEANPQAKENWEKYRKLANDPRVTTKTARFIRKASIDELPQLWNVLMGDMSLVGPRPILEDEIPYFGETIKEYLSVKPGLTGLWQVSGRNDTSFKRRVYWDSWYVRNWSLWGDIVILIKTPFVLISRKGAS
ncbi:MAG: exopolysaccharide biosynthesis polyprenyl glycosylphosphotransferase [Alphaproteobacteria bacterium]|nr:exopolysaccharide biosynthesis polyprenyl glycosylphosphotransferase [Alphaproteobacteria bacterium]